jgi:hypothetical protein
MRCDISNLRRHPGLSGRARARPAVPRRRRRGPRAEVASPRTQARSLTLWRCDCRGLRAHAGPNTRPESRAPPVHSPAKRATPVRAVVPAQWREGARHVTPFAGGQIGVIRGARGDLQVDCIAKVEDLPEFLHDLAARAGRIAAHPSAHHVRGDTLERGHELVHVVLDARHFHGALDAVRQRHLLEHCRVLLVDGLLRQHQGVGVAVVPAGRRGPPAPPVSLGAAAAGGNQGCCTTAPPSMQRGTVGPARTRSARRIASGGSRARARGT